MTITRHPIPVSTRAPGGHTNAYVVGEDPAILVDPAGRTPDLDRIVRERGVGHVVVTHTHPDHVGAVSSYAAELEATVWARYGRDFRFEAATGVRADATLSPGDVLEVGGGSLQVLDAPGHAPDHLAFVERKTGAVLVGDCAVTEGSVAVGAPEGDMRAYLSTLRRLYARGPPRLYPGHGPPVADPRERLAALLEHRKQRERRVLAAVDGGARTIDAILDAAYDKPLDGVRDLAGATVEAHLEKLAVEGAVTWDGARTDVTGRAREGGAGSRRARDE
ncbi:MBL fold metallo-hydrolase [Natronosalvus caseinilyticus]|uniref:MBL fold metallo-hydrolase n=1 Tax=Natronosalvus caseinilyticus TaxID=2953747 RepID=UPI0028A87E5F|nr:MBL fold metallo-hydrolase [Natronosalvus caseinilyticus]